MSNEENDEYELSKGHLTQEKYYDIAKHTQLVSVDLILFNELGQVLLGKRINNPAKDLFFTPGGKVRKFELFQNAIQRISINEIGFDVTSYDSGTFTGVYHHIYDNNFRDDSFGTHYINFAYSFQNIPTSIISSYSTSNHSSYHEQHDEFKWFDIPSLLESPLVHSNVKNYFHTSPWNKI